MPEVIPASSPDPHAGPSTNGAPRVRTLTKVVHLGVAVIALLVALIIGAHGYIDLDVYRAASAALLHGHALYGSLPNAPFDLKYIYPPFAAVLLAPLTVLPLGPMHVVWTLCTVTLVLGVLHVLMSRLGIRTAMMTPLLLLAPALLLEPIRSTLGFGQINMVLVALVVADCTGVIPRRFRGVGIGIAAAIKITPAAFGLLLLLRKDYSSAVRSASAFLLAAAIGGVFAPRDSTLFWTQVFFDTNRAGAPWYGPNQAITGPLTRLGLTGTPETLTWILGAVLIVGAATYAAWHFTRTGEHVAALGVIALASLLSAPFAVSHHWSYVIILLPLLVAAQYRRWRYLLAIAVIVFLVGAQWYLPIGDERELHWTVLQQVVGDSECLIGIAMLVGAVIAARSRAQVGAAPLTDVTAVEAGLVDATSAGASQRARFTTLPPVRAVRHPFLMYYGLCTSSPPPVMSTTASPPWCVRSPGWNPTGGQRNAAAG